MTEEFKPKPLLTPGFMLLVSLALGLALAGVILLFIGDQKVRWLTDLTIFVSFVIFVGLLVHVVVQSRRQKKLAQKLATEMTGTSLRLERIDKMKSEFVSIASHQLRSPLTTIRGAVSMILEGSYGEVSPKVREVLERVEHTSKSMSLAVEDYLNVSRIESGNMKYELSEVDLCALVKSVVETMKTVGEEKGHALSLKFDGLTSAMAKVDVGKAEQILQNLIDNAFKYTKDNKPVSVEVKLDQSKRNCLINVIDQGIGIAPEEITELFNKFQRAGNANSVNVHGTGLGLYIAKKMAMAMHGDVTASSMGEGHGSTFTISLPVTKVK